MLSIALLLFALKSVTSLSCLDNPAVGQWIKGENGFFPSGAVVAGFQDANKTDLYLCRIEDVVGKYYEPTKSCWIEDKNGKERQSTQYEILVNVGHVVWVPIYPKQLPCNLIPTGWNSTNPTYAGRSWVSNKFLIPGNVINGVNYIAWGSNTYSETFEALTAVPKSINLYWQRSSNIYGTIVKHFIFKVKSEDEVYVDFGMNTDMKYRLTIGTFKNRVSGFGPLSDSLRVYEKTDHILDSNAMKGFWVRWTFGNTIEFGAEGTANPILTFTDDKIHDLNSVQMGSSGYKDSYWQIPDLTKYNGKEFVKHYKHSRKHRHHQH